MSQRIQTPSIDDLLLRTAAILLNDVGDGFTMDQLSSRANVSRATVYRRVGSKEALLQRLAQMRGLPMEERDLRKRILEAVPRVIGRHGLVGATMEQIADEAGVGVATVYRYFGDKDGVVRAFIGEWTPHTTLGELVLHPSADVAADLAALAETALRFLYQHRDVLRVVLLGSEREQAYFNQLRTGPTRLRDLVVTYFVAQMRAGRIEPVAEPQEVALAFVGLLFAFAVLGPLQYGTRIDDPKHTAHVMTRIFLDQLRAGTGEQHGT